MNTTKRKGRFLKVLYCFGLFVFFSESGKTDSNSINLLKDFEEKTLYGRVTEIRQSLPHYDGTVDALNSECKMSVGAMINQTLKSPNRIPFILSVGDHGPIQDWVLSDSHKSFPLTFFKARHEKSPCQDGIMFPGATCLILYQKIVLDYRDDTLQARIQFQELDYTFRIYPKKRRLVSDLVCSFEVH